jgi:hypothetical protein
MTLESPPTGPGTRDIEVAFAGKVSLMGSLHGAHGNLLVRIAQ